MTNDLNRLISYIHHTCEYKPYCFVGNIASNAGWDCFKTPILREISGGTLCVEAIHLFRQVGYQEQTYLWNLTVTVLGNTTQNHDRTVRPVVSSSEICFPPHTIHKRKQSRRVINDLDNVELIPSNVESSHQEALLYVFEDTKGS